MNRILEEILEHKRQVVIQAKREIGWNNLDELTESVGPVRPFVQALQRPQVVSIIAEIKKASPSAGIIRPVFNPEDIARDFERHGAAAISVLTDERFFHSSLSSLQQVRRTTSLPLLRKDFIVDPYQVFEARAYGADAILLILAAISNAQAIELFAAAMEAGLAVLFEVHSGSEIERLLPLEPRCVGINNRDLQTFQVDIETTAQLEQALPQDVSIVSESGFKKRSDAERVGKLGVDAILIGESLMRQQDVGVALDKFTGVAKWSRSKSAA